jgi:Domain of unknown function DUF83
MGMSNTCAANNIPRVTEILKPYSGLDYVPKKILENAAARGTSVHALCAGIARGNWVPDSMIDDNLLGYVNSFRKWSDAQVSKFITIEKRFTEPDMLYTGQLDFVVLGNDDKLYLVDLKTTAKPSKTHPVQMAAYNRLLKRHGIIVEAAVLVYLKADGDFPDVNMIHDLTKEFSVFTSALECWEYFYKRKEKKK